MRITAIGYKRGSPRAYCPRPTKTSVSQIGWSLLYAESGMRCRKAAGADEGRKSPILPLSRGNRQGHQGPTRSAQLRYQRPATLGLEKASRSDRRPERDSHQQGFQVNWAKQEWRQRCEAEEGRRRRGHPSSGLKRAERCRGGWVGAAGEVLTRRTGSRGGCWGHPCGGLVQGSGQLFFFLGEGMRGNSDGCIAGYHCLRGHLPSRPVTCVCVCVCVRAKGGACRRFVSTTRAT